MLSAGSLPFWRPQFLLLRTIKTQRKIRNTPPKILKRKFETEKRDSNRASRRRDPNAYKFRPNKGRWEDRRVETSPPERWERGKKRRGDERSESRNVTDELWARVQKTPKQDQKVSNLVNEALAKYDISSRKSNHSPPRQDPRKTDEWGRKPLSRSRQWNDDSRPDRRYGQADPKFDRQRPRDISTRESNHSGPRKYPRKPDEWNRNSDYFLPRKPMSNRDERTRKPSAKPRKWTEDVHPSRFSRIHDAKPVRQSPRDISTREPYQDHPRKYPRKAEEWTQTRLTSAQEWAEDTRPRRPNRNSYPKPDRQSPRPEVPFQGRPQTQSPLNRTARSENHDTLPTKPPPEKLPPQEKQPKGPSKIWELVKRKTKVESLHPDTPLSSEWSILAINKPAGILSQAGIPGEGTILDLLARDFPDLTNLKGVHRYPPTRKSRKGEVNWGGRLDKNTSGVMIFGKDDDTTTRLHDAFRDKRIGKSYLALLKPRPGSPLYSPDLTACPRTHITESSPGVIQGTFTRLADVKTGREDNVEFVPEHEKIIIYQALPGYQHEHPGCFTWGTIFSCAPRSKSRTVTHFHVLARLEAQSKVFVLFRPETGKKHQLRLHAAFALGAPVVGDHRYGYPDNIGHLKPRIEDGVYKDGYALHCYHMALDGEFSFTAEVPTDKWGAVWDCVRERIKEREFRGMVGTLSGQGQGGGEWMRFWGDTEGWVRDLRDAWRKNEFGKWEEEQKVRPIPSFRAGKSMARRYRDTPDIS